MRRRVDTLVARREALLSERELLVRYRPLIAAFESLAASAAAEQLHGSLVLLREGGVETVASLRSALEGALGAAVELREQPLTGGETALLVLVPAASARRLEELLARARVEEVKLPVQYGEGFLAALPRLRERGPQIVVELAETDKELATLAASAAPELVAARSLLHDRLQAMEVLPLLGSTQHAVVVEGWVPAGGMERLRRALAVRLADRVSVEQLGREPWPREDAPVELANPRLFRPFEALMRPLPLPRYGTIDPTPFVAVFFPMFFGLILGDIGYGAGAGDPRALASARRRGPAAPAARSPKCSAPARCSASSFGVLFGEFFGDLGRRWFGHASAALRPRARAAARSSALAVALGAVHIMLGLVARRRATPARRIRGRRSARALAGHACCLIVVALLAALEVLPHGLLTPAVVGLLVRSRCSSWSEGIIAPIELLSTLGHILSYARIMALGTASVMLAVVANRMVGSDRQRRWSACSSRSCSTSSISRSACSARRSTRLRLHYVEFFGKFYSPGGRRIGRSRTGVPAGTPAEPKEVAWKSFLARLAAALAVASRPSPPPGRSRASGRPSPPAWPKSPS